jgi:ferric-dicitrate binding protein FerR (iron transport regulator)
MNRKTTEKESVNSDLLLKYFSGNKDTSGYQRVRDWFMITEYEEELKYRLKEHWNQFEVTSEDHPDKEEILNRIYGRIFRDQWSRTKKRSFVRRAYVIFSRVAALLILPLMLFAGWYLLGNGVKKGEERVEIYSPLGARVHFTLPDGSKVWLNSGSVLTYPSRFRGKERQVSLSGEGYFEVKKNPDRPFVVKTGSLLVTALGTRFDVISYPQDKMVDVVLISGKVDLYRGSDLAGKRVKITSMKERWKVVVTKNGKKIAYQAPVMTEKYEVWKDGKLVFKNDPMAEVVERINRWYNVRLIIKDEEILEYRYRATFNDETLDEVLKMLKITSPIDYYEPKRKVSENGEVGKKQIYLFLKKNEKQYVSFEK